MPETKVEKLMPWRKSTIGGMTAQRLLLQSERNSYVEGWACNLISEKVLATRRTKQRIETIVLSPADFGFEEYPTTAELLNPTRLLEWSKQNTHRLPEGSFVELLPTEAGPHIRDQYKDQPKGEYLTVASERIIDPVGKPNLFVLAGDCVNEKPHLGSSEALPDGRWQLDTRLLFRLRKVAP